jgi:hypothetical protein
VAANKTSNETNNLRAIFINTGGEAKIIEWLIVVPDVRLLDQGLPLDQDDAVFFSIAPDLVP